MLHFSVISRRNMAQWIASKLFKRWVHIAIMLHMPHSTPTQRMHGPVYHSELRDKSNESDTQQWTVTLG